MRAAEYCGKFEIGMLSPANLSWKIDGVFLAWPRRAQLENLSVGDLAVIRPPTSKADPFGLHFGATPIYLAFDPDDIACAAGWLAKLMLTVEFPPERLSMVPLFPRDLTLRPFTIKQANKHLLAMLTKVIGEIEAKKRSMHSFRIGCACLLLAAGATPSQIQALCRWRSEDSVKIYARLSSGDYARWVRKALQQSISPVSSCNLPTIDGDEIIAALRDHPEVLDRLDGED